MTEEDIKKLEDRTQGRLKELRELEVSCKQEEQEAQLRLLQELLQEWPHLAQDDRTVLQLQQLQIQVRLRLAAANPG